RREVSALGLGYTSGFSIYDQADSVKLVKLCLREMGYTSKDADEGDIQARISKAKNYGFDAALYADTYAASGDSMALLTASVFKLYDTRLREHNALDFDDLLGMAVAVLRHPQVRERYAHQSFHYLLIDEFQDTNAVQARLVESLSSYHRNVCAVG